MMHLDFETYSDIDIIKSGAYAYATSRSTKVLMMAYAFGDEPVTVVDLLSGGVPKRVEDAIMGTEIIHAYNANFERLILKHVMGYRVPIEKFVCTQVRAYTLGFKGGLDRCLSQFDIDEYKYPRGKQLMKIFSMPCETKGTPEEYAEYMTYCAKDVEVERILSHKLDQYPTIHASEHDLYALDQKINDQGLPIDTVLVKSALEVAATEKKILFATLGQMTGLANPNSNKQFKEWMLKAHGVDVPNMQKATIDKLVHTNLPTSLIAAITLKQQLSKTSTAKWDAIARSLCLNGRIHGAFQFIGASRTGRWAGRIIQPQNLPRGTISNPDTACDLIIQGHDMLSMMYPSVMDVLSSTIRGSIRSGDNYLLAVSDLSSIESRLIGWLTDCKRINALFSQGMDTYKDLASRIFDVDYTAVTKEQRTLAKPASLGGQYMLGGKGLQAYAENFGVKLTEEQAQGHIATYRGMYPEIPAFWYWLKDTINYVLTTGVDAEGYRLKFAVRGDFLFIKLLSGRNIPYYKPEMQMLPAPWDKDQLIEAFTYMGMDSYTNQWKRISAHAGGVTENIVQAIARDVLAVWLTRVDAQGMDIVGHVHDEIIVESRKHLAGSTLQKMNSLIEKPISWAPGLLLTAEGFTAKRYKK